MKKILLKMEGMGKMLTREQMKHIAGGGVYPGCVYYINENCGGGTWEMVFSDPNGCTDDCSCQDQVDRAYAGDDCCDNIDCGCQ